MVLNKLKLSLEVVLHVLVPLLHLFDRGVRGHVAESAIIGSHDLPHIVKFVVEELVGLGNTRTDLLEGLLEALDALVIHMIHLVLDLLIKGMQSVHDELL